MKKGGIILIIFGLFWSGMTLLFDGVLIVPAVKQVLAQQFAATRGTVLSSEVTHKRGDDGPIHGVCITYSYVVAGREYTGDRFRYGKFTSSDSAWARQAVREYPAGSATAVYYDPSNPAESVLQPGLGGSELFMALFATPFNAVMFGFWWVGWNRLSRRWRKLAAGGVKLKTELRQTRARLTEFSPLTSFLATIALLAFLSMFVVGFCFSGFHPSLRVMTATWFIVLAVGGLMGGWYWKNILAGKYDLVVDDLNGKLHLPQTCGRKTQKTFALAEVQEAYVETVEKRDSEGDVRYTYIPTLRLGTAAGPAEQLAEWHDADRAREFVAWLNEKLARRQPLQTPVDR